VIKEKNLFFHKCVNQKVMGGVWGLSINPWSMFMRPVQNLLAATAIAVSGLFATSQAIAADIVDTAVSAGNFKTLVAAVKAAGLAEALKGAGPLTVFAPTDEAFAKLPAGTVESLLKPANRDKLIAILTYHVLPRELMSNQLPAGPIHVRTLKTKGDRTLAITKGEGVTIDNANVISANIKADNGVIHVIDAVLIPKV
jgi:uncharacterized surface protein with fasciclin (FAS1) repeats